MSRVLLEVAVRHQRDVPGCLQGGADRLALVVEGPGGGVSPEPAAASAVIRASSVPVRVVLRTGTGWSADEEDLDRLAALGREFVALGAEGLVLGFLDRDLEVDVAACTRLVAALPAVPWTFHRAIDSTLDRERSWGRLLDLPRLDAVRSGGSPQGLAHGYDDLLALARRSPDVARLVMASGGLEAEQVPWLVRAGVRQVHVGTQVRPGATYRSYVDAGYVRSWRRLLDDASLRLADRADPSAS